MAGELGTAVVRTEVDLSGLDQGLSKAEGNTRSWASNLGGTIAKVGGAAVLGGIGLVASGVAAIGGAAVVAAKDFAGFQQQMNEVFTLLPGISEDAMAEMTGQVKDFAREFGVLPENVVPALYQSLSAGVPPDNVFSFLETAQKAAAGGVTELETAVNGISSVINAYGADVLDAAQASDFMFTAVRLGKTTFGELSSSLANVTPTASALGLGFDNLTAAIATMTSQGVSTAQSTTQLRQLLIEMSKAGTATSNAFQEIAGVGFAEFIAEGNNLQDALGVMQQAADANGVALQDMFSSVEAGAAALSLAGPGAESFGRNLEAMAESAGATDAAFETMDKGLKQTWNRIVATAKVGLLDFADAFGPLLERIADFAEAALPKIGEVIDTVVVPAVQSVVEWIERVIDVFTQGAPISEFFTIFEDGSSKFAMLIELFGAGETQAQNIATAIVNLAGQVRDFLDPVIAAIGKFVSWKDVLIALGAAITVVVGGALLALAQAILPIIAVVGLVIGAVSVLRNAWENNWGGIQEKTKAVVTFVQNIITTVMNAVQTFWAQNGDAILSSARQVWTTIQTVVTTVITTVQAIIQAVTAAIRAAWDAHGAEITASAQRFWRAIQAFISSTIETIRSIIVAVASAIQSFWEQHGAAIMEGARDAWETVKEIIDTLTQNISVIIDTWTALLSGDWEAWLDGIKEYWQNVWDAILLAVEAFWEFLSPIIEGIISEIKEALEPTIQNLQAKFESVFAAIQTAIQPAIDLVNNFFSGLKDLWSWLKDKIFSFKVNLPSIPDWALPGGSPTPLQHAWEDLERSLNSMVIAPKFELPSMEIMPVGMFSPVYAGASGDTYEDRSSSVTVYGGMQAYGVQSPQSWLEEIQDLQVPG